MIQNGEIEETESRERRKRTGVQYPYKEKAIMGNVF
jgi:hypothetical protein